MDLGIVNSSGRPVSNTVPASWLGRADSPTHRGTFGSFTDAQINAMLAQLAYSCSEWNNAAYDLSQYTVGRYSVTSDQLTTYGYLNSKFVNDHGPSSMTYTVAWTGLDGLTDMVQYMLSTLAQDRLAYWLMKNNYDSLLALGAITENDSLSIVSGMLFVSHILGSTSNALDWRINGSTDNRTYDYFNAGRYAIEVLA